MLAAADHLMPIDRGECLLKGAVAGFGRDRAEPPGAEAQRDMNHLDLNLIRVFVAIYETRSVTHAAERLDVTQPTISYMVTAAQRD